MTPTTEQLKDLLDKVTPGGWTGHNMVHSETGKQMTPEEIGEYVCRSVGMGDHSRFLFVSGKHDDGDDCDICLTGNGPRGPFNTALIALAPTLAAEVVRLRGLLNNAKRILNREAILALPSEYDEDEQWMIDEFSMRVGLESCRKCAREARQALSATSAA